MTGPKVFLACCAATGSVTASAVMKMVAKRNFRIVPCRLCGGWIEGVLFCYPGARIMAYPFRTGQAGSPATDKTQYNSLVVRVAAPADAAALAALAREVLEYERSLNEYAGELAPWAASPE